MCGIVGYAGKRSAQDVLLDGLEKLEYRGYDSAGVALAQEGGIRVVKSKGRLDALRQKLAVQALAESSCGIGHTRWATHGEPSDVNSHPHSTPRVSIVHNGIIENYGALKERLAARGVSLALINASSLKPLDADALARLSGSNTPYFTLEEAWPSAGLGGEIAHYCAENKLRPPEKMLGLPDAFIAQGERRALLARCGLTGEQIADQIQKAVCK